MDAAKWGRICTNNGFSMLRPIMTREGRVLIAERYFNIHPEYPAPHYQTIWAFDRDKVDVAQKLFFSFGGATQAQRVAAAVNAASEHIKDNLAVGRYKH